MFRHRCLVLIIPVILMIVFSACGGPSDDNRATEATETAVPAGANQGTELVSLRPHQRRADTE